MGRETFHFRVGDVECMAVRDATELTPWKDIIVGAEDPAVAKALRERGLPATDIPWDFSCLFARSGNDLIAIDTGWGSCTERLQGQFLANLCTEGVSPSDVSFVLITHHDRDHLAGIVAADGTLAFPNARHVLTQEGWAWYTSEKNLASLPEPQAGFHRKVRALLEGRVELVSGEAQVAPGIRILPAPGHRPGHVVVELASKGERLLHLADTIPLPIFVDHPEWKAAFDSVQDEAWATRQRLLDLAESENALVFLSHFPFPGLGHITREGGTRRWRPISLRPRSATACQDGICYPSERTDLGKEL
jgi:glyoxylase-like metal-dependent hydrolase (beta-lactamase superfamily II)